MLPTPYPFFSPLTGIMVVITDSLLLNDSAATGFSPLTGIMVVITTGPDRQAHMVYTTCFSPLTGIMVVITQDFTGVEIDPKTFQSPDGDYGRYNGSQLSLIVNEFQFLCKKSLQQASFSKSSSIELISEHLKKGQNRGVCSVFACQGWRNRHFLVIFSHRWGAVFERLKKGATPT